MKKTVMMLGVLGFLVVFGSVSCAGHGQLKAFPDAMEGMERFVIVLPEKAKGEEEASMVELMAGKVMMTDGVNLVRLGSAIEPRPLTGWGYTYYEVTGSSAMMSTMMAAPEGAPQVEAFVMGTPLKVRYNSKLPIVVYAPEGYEIRYRIWKASETVSAAEKK
ncbi:ecotin family protein [Desulfoluna spongiiphila]|uniref:Ecotin n=1 Tax=Desulfoluna spongiiphila TaxID=419481 RepID=A0A1G5IS06_9BACT|nr:ecotin family protein [Desulfoluna spongiiphila]SCY78530.1 ecotin [Desulfoluna spongiiphila]